MVPTATILPSGPAARAARRGALGRRRTAGALLLAVLAAGLAAAGVLVTGAGRAVPAAAPTPGVGAAASRLGAPEPLPVTSGSYAFLRLQQRTGEPVAFDPCRPVHWTLRATGAPSGGEAGVEWAVDRISRATGLQFVRDADTDEAPGADRPAFQPDRYGDRWAPILVAWADPGEAPDLIGAPAGRADVTTRYSRLVGAEVAVTGQLVLDGPQLTNLVAAPDTAGLLRAVVLHELAHVIGLGHVSDPTQVMAASASVLVTDLGVGDRTGLARLGAGPCAPDL